MNKYIKCSTVEDSYILINNLKKYGLISDDDRRWSSVNNYEWDNFKENTLYCLNNDSIKVLSRNNFKKGAFDLVITVSIFSILLGIKYFFKKREIFSSVLLIIAIYAIGTLLFYLFCLIVDNVSPILGLVVLGIIVISVAIILANIIYDDED